MFSAPVLLGDLYLLLWCVALLLPAWWRYARIPYSKENARKGVVFLTILVPVLLGIDVLFGTAATSSLGSIFLLFCAVYWISLWISPTNPPTSLRMLMQEFPEKMRLIGLMLIIVSCSLLIIGGITIFIWLRN